jgi:hypothetical protein
MNYFRHLKKNNRITFLFISHRPLTIDNTKKKKTGIDHLETIAKSTTGEYTSHMHVIIYIYMCLKYRTSQKHCIEL